MEYQCYLVMFMSEVLCKNLNSSSDNPKGLAVPDAPLLVVYMLWKPSTWLQRYFKAVVLVVDSG